MGEQAARLLARAGDGDALAEEGAALEPVQGLTQIHHIAEDGDGRRLELFFSGKRGDRAERSGKRLVASRGRPADKGDGGLFGHAGGTELFCDGTEALDTHQHHLGAGSRSDRLVVDARGLLARFLVAGEDRQHGVAGAVSHRDAGVGEATDRRGDSGDDLEAESRGGECLRLLATAAEEERVSPLESHDALSGGGVLHQQGIGLLLLEGMASGGLPCVDDHSGGRDMAQEFGVGEVVVEDDLGLLEAVATLEGEKSRVAGAGADEIADALGGRRDGAFPYGFLGDLFGHDERSWSATSRAASSGEEAEALPVRSRMFSVCWSAT